MLMTNCCLTHPMAVLGHQHKLGHMITLVYTSWGSEQSISQSAKGYQSVQGDPVGKQVALHAKHGGALSMYTV